MSARGVWFGQVDTNGDGIPSGSNDLQGVGPLGRFQLRGFTEWEFDASVICQPSHVGMSVVMNTNVATYTDLSQLMFDGDTGEVCIDVFARSFEGEIRGDLVGGGGRFEGAQGSFVAAFAGVGDLISFSRIFGTLEIQFSD